MLSSSRLGLLVLVVVPWKKINCNVLLPSPAHHVTRSMFTLAFSRAPSSRRISSGFKSGHVFSPPASFPAVCCRSLGLSRWPLVAQQQQRRGDCWRIDIVRSVSVDFVTWTSGTKEGGPLYYRTSALSSTSCYSSVMLRSARVAQQQHRKRTNSRRSHQMNSILVEAISSTDDPTKKLNQKPLDDELHRYGVDESDYDYTSTNVVQQQPNFLLDIKKHKIKSTMLRKRRATAELISGSKQEQHLIPEGESGVVKDWCAYLLLSVDAKKTYVGVTYDIRRRLRQHNGEIAGGAKSARAGRPWRLVCTVRGFNTRSEACQFEWRWKSTAAKIKTIVQEDSEIMESPLVTRRRATLAVVLKAKEEWSYLNVQWHAK